MVLRSIELMKDERETVKEAKKSDNEKKRKKVRRSEVVAK